jgi:hypothetical protein
MKKWYNFIKKTKLLKALVILKICIILFIKFFIKS